MRLANLWQRAIPPEPWQEGDNIPWNDPAFCARMLDEHLSQAHKSSHNRDVYLDGLFAIQHAREHGYSLLGEGVGQMSPTTASGV